MKKRFIFILLLVFFSIFINCEHNENIKNCEQEEIIKFFSPEKMSELSLNYVGNFWTNDTIDHISDYVTENFHTNPGHLASVRYSSNTKVLAVSVFESQEIAIEAMEERRNNVQCLIEKGNSDLIKGCW
jgi:hypothetical protein